MEVALAYGDVEGHAERSLLLAECADALWPADQITARELFRGAWRVATEADEAEHESEQGEDGSGHLFHDLSARRQMLATVAKRDPRLAEEFLDGLRAWMEKHARPGEGAEKSEAARRGPGRCGATAARVQRMDLAHALFADGAHEAAADVIAPLARCGADGDLVLFLYGLAGHVPERSNAIFLALLEAARTDPSADADAALAAAAYLAPPGLLTTVDANGSSSLVEAARGPAKAPARPVPPGVREAFYETAAALLLRRPQPSGAGRNPAALYFAVGRLLPFFESEAPRHAPALHALRASLASEIEPGRRALIERQTAVRRLTSENPTDPLRSLLDGLEHLADPAARDALLLRASHAAARRRIWARAKETALRIGDEAKRRSALLLIAARQVANLREAFTDPSEQDVERAAGFVRATDLPPVLRALGLARAATLAAARRDRRRSLELLDEALARATEADEPFRVAAALLAADHAARLDSPRVWEAVAAAVAAVNSDEGDYAPGPEFYLERGAGSREESETLHEILGGYSLEAVFGLVAPHNFARALAEARAVSDVLTRSRSLVAAARAVIERKEATTAPRAAP